MHIQIRYFASLREITGEDEEQLTVPNEATITDVRIMVLTRYSQLRPILERCVYAVNHRYVPAETILKEGDELVFIPPTGGGTFIQPLIQLTREPLDRDALVRTVSHPSVGGIVVFEGVVRDNARGKQVRYLEYDVYEEMAIEQIRTIITEAQQRWGVERVAVAHRFGRLEIGEASVIIVVASPHRSEAFDACRYIIDTLKRTVPIWKKEVATDGETWVEG
ncbi:MAG TPA: molybdenum cofactor biosynthesis protein MoaE [Ktedonobacteraceae bacterium]|jgi:molybdopterin synthase catalytic subunit